MSRNLLFILLLGAGFCSCSELYDYKSDADANYLVVEGMITDDAGPYLVTLSKAIAYTNDLNVKRYRPGPETKAVVKIFSDKGEEVTLEEQVGKPGTYLTKAEELTGETGHSYWLHIETASGDVYESQHTIMLHKPDITRLYAVASQKEVLDESLPDPVIVKKQGLQLTCDIDNSNAADYIKIDFQSFSPFHVSIDSTFYAKDIMYPSEDTISLVAYVKQDESFCYILANTDPTPVIIGAGSENLFLSGMQVGYITKNIPFVSNDTTYEELPDYYVIADLYLPIWGDQVREVIGQVLYDAYYFADIKAYAITDTVYEYYRNLKEQLTADNKIFDPIPVDLTGNIKCMTDPGKNAYGIFTAASVRRKQFMIHWPGYYSSAYIEAMDEYFPVQSSGCTDEQPSFWRDF
jgi:hypothetical protein